MDQSNNSGQYFLAPVLVPAYNTTTFQSNPLPTPQNTYFPQQQQQQPQQTPLPAAVRARNDAQRAASIWLAMKLVVILFILCQGASIQRVVFFHIIAFFVFLHQTGRLRVVVRRVRIEDLNNRGDQMNRGNT